MIKNRGEYWLISKQNLIEVKGFILEALPNATFKVKLENGVIVTCTISGKIRMNHIRILPGDEVLVEMSPYNLKQGRISFRYK